MQATSVLKAKISPNLFLDEYISIHIGNNLSCWSGGVGFSVELCYLDCYKFKSDFIQGLLHFILNEGEEMCYYYDYVKKSVTFCGVLFKFWNSGNKNYLGVSNISNPSSKKCILFCLTKQKAWFANITLNLKNIVKI